MVFCNQNDLCCKIYIVSFTVWMFTVNIFLNNVKRKMKDDRGCIQLSKAFKGYTETD